MTQFESIALPKLHIFMSKKNTFDFKLDSKNEKGYCCNSY